MRRWLANKLESWSYTLADWADRVRPPYRRPPGPESELEKLTGVMLSHRAQAVAEEVLADQYRKDWERMARPNAKVGETLRIRLPNEYEVKNGP